MEVDSCFGLAADPRVSAAAEVFCWATWMSVSSATMGWILERVEFSSLPSVLNGNYPSWVFTRCLAYNQRGIAQA